VVVGNPPRTKLNASIGLHGSINPVLVAKLKILKLVIGRQKLVTGGDLPPGMELVSIIGVALPRDRPCPLASATPQRADRGGANPEPGAETERDRLYEKTAA
jgi:hypothetical protein